MSGLWRWVRPEGSVKVGAVAVGASEGSVEAGPVAVDAPERLGGGRGAAIGGARSAGPADVEAGVLGALGKLRGG